MDLLAIGAAYLAATRKSFAASTVTYARGVVTASIAATKGRSQLDLTDSEGFLTRVEVTDFLVNTADLVLSAATTLPAEGDRITDSAGFVHEVRSPGAGIDPWRYADAHRIELRIHTVLITTP